jgi:hypothetical protein
MRSPEEDMAGQYIRLRADGRQSVLLNVGELQVMYCLPEARSGAVDSGQRGCKMLCEEASIQSRDRHFQSMCSKWRPRLRLQGSDGEDRLP